MKNVLYKIIEYVFLGALPSSDKHKLDYLFEFNFRQCGTPEPRLSKRVCQVPFVY